MIKRHMRDDPAPVIGKYGFTDVREGISRLGHYCGALSNSLLKTMTDGSRLVSGGTYDLKEREQDQSLLCVGPARDRKWELRVYYFPTDAEVCDWVDEMKVSCVNQWNSPSWRFEKVRLIAKFITVESSVSEDVIAAEFSLAYDRVLDAERKTSTLEGWAASEYDMQIRCGCGHSISIDSRDIMRRFGPAGSIEEAKTRLRCNNCGTRGRANVRPLFR